LLHYLTTWNVLEFKGRSVSARIRDLDLLVELGLGIDRRLNEERTRQKRPPLDASEVSFWYIVNHLGRRYLTKAQELLGNLEQMSPGVWHCQVMRRQLFLIDGQTVPVERESVPLHLAGEGSREIDEALARLIVEEPGYWELYGSLLGALHPNIFEEASHMATTKGKRGDLDLRPFIAKVGLKKIFNAVELGDLIDAVGPKKVLKELGIERILANLSVQDRLKLKEQLK
jgi:hypothetical protein